MNFARIGLLFMAASGSLLGGCATVTSGTSQSVIVESIKAGGEAAPGYDCVISNGKGAYKVTTPGSFTISKAYGDAEVKCEKPGETATTARVQSGTKAYTAGNIILGGVIGLGVDAMSGATWAYPDLWKIILGKSPQILKSDGSQLEGEELQKAVEKAASDKK